MITLLIPAYNEEAVIETMIRTLSAQAQLPEDYEILVVDDGSTDATPRLLDALRGEYPALRVVRHARNQGLGAALSTGFREARGRVIVTMDADLTHSPALIAPLVAACDGVELAVASRYAAGGGMRDVPWWRVALSRVANRLFQWCFATQLRDITAGFKAYRAAGVRDLPVVARGFEAQLEITIRLLKRGVTFTELPYTLVNRAVGESKMRYLALLPRYVRTLFHLFRFRWNLGKTPYDA